MIQLEVDGSAKPFQTNDDGLTSTIKIDEIVAAGWKKYKIWRNLRLSKFVNLAHNLNEHDNVSVRGSWGVFEVFVG